MITPPDPTRLKFRQGTWVRKTSNQWTDGPFRKTVLDFINGYVNDNGWVTSWEVNEHFAGQQGRAININRRKRDANGNLTRGQSNLAYPPGVNQSDNDPVLVLKVIRPNGTGVEVGLTFGMGLDTAQQTLDNALQAASSLWDASRP